MDRVEKLLEAALFALQQVIKKGEDQEELEDFQKSIKARDLVNTQTPTKSRIPQPKHGSLAQSIHAPANKTRQTLQQQTNPIRDNTLTIASEARMTKLKDMVTKVFNILENCNITLKEPKTTPMSEDKMDTSAPETSSQ